MAQVPFDRRRKRAGPTGAFVFIAEPDQEGVMRASVRSVLPAQTIGRDVVVFQGLDGDEQVIVDGSFKLREGAMVAGGPPQAADKTIAADAMSVALPNDSAR